MEKNKSSKRDRLEKLLISLQSNSGEKLHPEDEKYLKILQNKLSKNSKESTVNIYEASKKTEEKDDSLKPQVIIHHKEEEIEEPDEFIQSETEKVEVKEEIEIEDKELFEIKKIEVTEPEFIEVKPKETTKKVETYEKKITQKIEEPEQKEYEKLPEWEPVETKKVEQEQIEEKIEEEKPEIKEEEIKPVEGEKAIEEKIELESEDLIGPIEETKEESPELEPLDTELREFETIEDKSKSEFEEELFFEREKEQLPDEEKQKKLDAFKDITIVDEKTAVLLYDNGFTSIDDLKIASLKDLCKIKGIKRKLAKKIKKEVEELEKAEGIKDSTQKEEIGESFVLEEEFEEEKKEEEFLTEDLVEEDEFIEEEKIFFEEDEEQTLTAAKKDESIEIFRGIESIDEKTALLLIENGIASYDILKETPVKELAKIDGIGKKLAKKIKREIKRKEKAKKKAKKTVFSIAEAYDKEISKDFEEPTEQIAEKKKMLTETKKVKKKKPRKKQKHYKHGVYGLYKKNVKTKSKKSKDKDKGKREIYFFSRKKRHKAEPTDLPKGFEVRINKKTGVPYLRKKK